MPDWTDKQIAKLKKLWEEGFSTTEIGKRLEISKNAVVGKAHRLGLASRTSPIRNETVRTTKSAKSKKSTASLSGKSAKSAPKPSEKAKSAAKASPKQGGKASKQTIAAAKPVGTPLMELSPEMCCWPIDNEGEIQLFCGRRIFKSKPYCLEHCIAAYTGAGGSDAKDSKTDSDYAAVGADSASDEERE